MAEASTFSPELGRVEGYLRIPTLAGVLARSFPPISLLPLKLVLGQGSFNTLETIQRLLHDTECDFIAVLGAETELKQITLQEDYEAARGQSGRPILCLDTHQTFCQKGNLVAQS
jgi:hypothetical protein